LGLGALWLCPAASAGPADPYLTIEASNDNGTDVVTVPLSGVPYNDVTQQWMYMSGLIVMSNGAVINNITLIMTENSTFTPEVDPEVFMLFNLTAGGVSTTTFTVGTGPLGFSPMPGAIGDFSGAVNILDANGDGVVYTGTGNNGNSVFALYNGGNIFLERVPFLSAGPNGTETSGPLDTVAPIGATVSDINVALQFSVSAGDSVTGQLDFVVIPEPQTALLLILAAVAGVRRRPG